MTLFSNVVRQPTQVQFTTYYAYKLFNMLPDWEIKMSMYVTNTFFPLQSDLVYTNLTLTTYSQVLSVWQTRCLPPTGDGTLSVLGLIRVRNVVFCLQYYSLPILTALLTPVVQLVLALKDIYATHEHSS